MRFRSSERGQVLPLVALCLTVIMGFAAMAIDVGFIEYQQRQQQSAADAAAIAGAQALGYVGCNNQSTVAQNAGAADATTNGYTESTNGVPISVTINNPPASGPYASNNCAVQAIITNSQTQTFFTRLFGWTNGMPVTTEAVAASEMSAPGCAFLLGPSATPDFHGAKMNAAGCSMLINGSPTFDGGTIDFSEIGYTGSATDNGATFTGASPTQMLPVADPCQEVAGCRYLADNPPSTTSGCTMTISSSTIGPGCYSSFSTNGNGTLTMNPGLYVLTGTCNKCNTIGGSTLSGSGVTIYVAPGAAEFDIHGVTANLTACTTTCGTSPYAAVDNVLFYQPPSNTTAIKFAGPQSTYSGLIYAPTANVTYNGNAGTGYTLTVFGDWTLNGTGQNMNFTGPSQGSGLLPQAVLVQ